VVVISQRYWLSQFGGRTDVLGETIQIHSRQNPAAQAQRPGGGAPGAGNREFEIPAFTDFRIVGVMSEHFTGTLPPQQEQQTDFWIPFERGASMLLGTTDPEVVLARIRTATMRGIGRRHENVSVEAVIDELDNRFLDELPNLTGRPSTRYEVLDGLVFNAPVHRNTERQLKLFIGASVLLALVAAANISLFLLARAPGRQRELGIRMAVGAPIRRLARQLASEAAVLVLLSAALGLAISVWLAEFLRGTPFFQNAQWRDVSLLDWRVLVVIGVFVLLLTAMVSLAPIVGLKRLGIARSSRQIAARATVAQRVAGTVQIAIAGTLGGAAVAFTWYIGTLMFAWPGYQARDVHAVVLSGGAIRVENGVAVSAAAVDTARRREILLGVPGVTNVSFAGMAPGLSLVMNRGPMQHPNDPAQEIQAVRTVIDAHYVDVLQLRLIHGRSPSDTEVGAMLVNEAMARAVWGRTDVVGESLNIGSGSGPGGQVGEIVGVLEDLSYEHPAADVMPIAFLTDGTSMTAFQSLALVESRLSAGELREALTGLNESGELEGSILDVVPLEDLRGGLLTNDRARSFLTIGAALLVVLLAALGFYGTQRYLVSAGRREYAIRASLGAGPRSLGRLVMNRGLWLGLPGIVLGLPLAFIAVAWLRDDYVSRDISPLLVSIVAALALVVMLLAASIGPARQAKRTEPAPLLRED
jgi:ABC-type antimicrobial peptide transport system permease subunit